MTFANPVALRSACVAAYDTLTAAERLCVRRFVLNAQQFSRDGWCSAATVAAAAGWPLADTTALLARLAAAGVLHTGSRGYMLRPAFASIVVDRVLTGASTCPPHAALWGAKLAG